MSFRTIINRDGSQWMKGAGPEQDVVIGSRIRLARNIRGIPFPGAASHEDRAKVLEMVKGATALAKNLGQIEFVRLEEVSPWTGGSWWSGISSVPNWPPRRRTGR